jgi:hypothetical protein
MLIQRSSNQNLDIDFEGITVPRGQLLLGNVQKVMNKKKKFLTVDFFGVEQIVVVVDD